MAPLDSIGSMSLPPVHNTLRTSAFASFAWAVLFTGAGSVHAQNFVCEHRDLVKAAEQARIRSAILWTGVPLPADWSAPCPIVGNASKSAAGGSTQFQFADGEVFGWRMQVTGSHVDLLADVIPHEVDHMVRASLTRRPIARWLDEGCASLVESEQTHRELRTAARQVEADEINSAWLDALDYPTTGVEQRRLYAVGFSLVEFLLERGGPRRLLQLQADARSPTQGLQVHYGLTPDSLRTEWDRWRNKLGAECSGGHCALHQRVWNRLPECRCSSAKDNMLTIWTSRWCGPCRRFWDDWERNPQFRIQVQSRYHVHVRDIDVDQPMAASRSIGSVPLFELPDRRIIGYEGPQWLLEQLGIAPAVPVAPATAPVLPEETPVQAIADQNAETGRPTAELQPDPPNAQPAKPLDPPTPANNRISIPWRAIGSLLLSLLPVTGIVGGSLATGGIGGIALTLFSLWLKRRLGRKAASAEQAGRTEVDLRAPFPRQLDEARQLLGLRQSEGRVALLDAVRGMFVDDELDKLAQSGDAKQLEVVNALRSALNRRLDEVAPLATK